MIPYFNVVIRQESILDDAEQLLQAVRPTWKKEEIQYKTFKEGISNFLVGCYHNKNESDIVLIRIYGKNTELLIDRKTELNTIQKLQSEGFAAPLYATFVNGMCYSYIPGNVLDDVSIRDPHICKLVATTFVKLHSMNVEDNSGAAKPILFPTIRRMFQLMPPLFPDPAKQERYSKIVKSKADIEREIILLENVLTNLDSKVVFCHNDVLLKNIVHNKEKDEIFFIDYEYSGYNYQAYDIGNHFCEFAGVDNEDHSRYPDREFQLRWLRTYLQLFQKGMSKYATEVSDICVETFYVQVNKFALASYMLWGLWGFVQANNSTIDFDFIGFATGRLEQYYKRKEEFLALKLPN